MSRIGKKTIEIPEGVDVGIDDNTVKVKGPKGELTQEIPSEIEVSVKAPTQGRGPDPKSVGKVSVNPKKKTKKSSAFWGLIRTLIFNMIEGVVNGYEKQLEIEGVGYKASLEGNKIILNIGYSHSVEIQAPEGIEFKVEKNLITISGIDKQLVGQVAADIRAKKKPEPYKGKGIHYVGEIIRRKAGKKAAGTE